MSLALVHLDERDEVLLKPVSRELEVVKWCTQEVETTRAVEVLKTQQILERERKKEKERERERERKREEREGWEGEGA